MQAMNTPLIVLYLVPHKCPDFLPDSPPPALLSLRTKMSSLPLLEKHDKYDVMLNNFLYFPTSYIFINFKKYWAQTNWMYYIVSLL